MLSLSAPLHLSTRRLPMYQDMAARAIGGRQNMGLDPQDMTPQVLVMRQEILDPGDDTYIFGAARPLQKHSARQCYLPSPLPPSASPPFKFNNAVSALNSQSSPPQASSLKHLLFQPIEDADRANYRHAWGVGWG
ncbi:hypothetical protein D9615_010699 [Tricholomella constricta]|uniref:Uncharacterized protein n=1 Tax=Tricholomella constricta TaxID=117010 RepID=A0A8H5GJ71_9AGAR|nr:hypothetical protein D9615_010699 [Tricholomella constricta]